jgi:hypothetical protein
MIDLIGREAGLLIHSAISGSGFSLFTETKPMEDNTR